MAPDPGEVIQEGGNEFIVVTVETIVVRGSNFVMDVATCIPVSCINDRESGRWFSSGTKTLIRGRGQ